MPYKERVKKFQKYLQDEKIDLFLIEEPINLLYFTGLHFSVGKLYIHEKGADLFIDGRYFQVAKEKSPFPVHLFHKEGDDSAFVLSFAGERKKHLGFDNAYMHVAAYEKWLSWTGKNFHVVGKNKPVANLRGCKEEMELTHIRKSADINWRAFLYISSLIEVGVTEEFLAWRYEVFCREHGASKVSFDPIIAFGENSALPHYQSGKNRLKKDSIVLIDIGCVVENYCSDMTRCIFFGKKDPLLEKIYKIVRNAQKKAMEAVRPGITNREIDRIAREEITKEGFGDQFVHGLGHGVGLEIHEFPSIKSTVDEVILQKGMVITIEPGIYIPGHGGIRYEDTIIVTENGSENLYPREAPLV
ncbi:MAG: Xaa-Pro peptidase family protein [Chlamydiota bacterium]